MRFPFFPALAAIAVAALAAAAPRAEAKSAGTPYKGVIVTDAATGRVLFEQNADAVSPPASMTKLMTYAVLVDLIRNGTIALSTPVTVTPADARIGMRRDSTSVWLRQGEVFTVEELIYAMMIQSANDAAYALAARAGGSIDEFVALMNAKARELGMTHSTFRSPHGLPPPGRRIADGDLTTPRDYAILCRHLLLHTEILKYTSVKTRLFGAGVRLQPTRMSNHNHLLGRIPGVDGLKTGFTNGAGFCLSATAQRGGKRVIVVMMDSPDPRTRDLHVQELIQRGFELMPAGGTAFPSRPVADAVSPIMRAPVGPPMNAAPQEPASDTPMIRFPVPGSH